jgi:hypothetical protein
VKYDPVKENSRLGTVQLAQHDSGILSLGLVRLLQVDPGLGYEAKNDRKDQ